MIHSNRAKINVLIGTFNLNGRQPGNDLSEWLINRLPFNPDIVALCLQEIGGGANLLNCTELLQLHVNNNSASRNKYKQIVSSNLADTTVLLVYAADVIVPRIKHTSEKSIPTTLVLWSFYGGKGAATASVKIDSSINFLFIGCHLCANDNEIERRNIEYAFILDQLKTEYESADMIFLFGDLNYRLDVDDSIARTYSITPGCWRWLLKCDQLTKEINKRTVFHFMHEPQIAFRPTYKFDINSDRYDTSAKARRPAWTDRILYMEKSDCHSICPLLYSSVEDIKTSDHRPVLAAFEVDSSYGLSSKDDRSQDIPSTPKLMVRFSRTFVKFQNVQFGKAYIASIAIENLDSQNSGSIQIKPIRHTHLACECLRTEPAGEITLSPTGDPNANASIRFIFELKPSSMGFLRSTCKFTEHIRFCCNAHYNVNVTVEAVIAPDILGKQVSAQADWIVQSLDYVEQQLARSHSNILSIDECSFGHLQPECVEKALLFLSQSTTSFEAESKVSGQDIPANSRFFSPSPTPIIAFSEQLCLCAFCDLLLKLLDCSPLPFLDCSIYHEFLSQTDSSEGKSQFESIISNIQNSSTISLLCQMISLSEKCLMTGPLSNSVFQHYDEFNQLRREHGIRQLYIEYMELKCRDES